MPAVAGAGRAWYARHSALTDPREHAALLAGLPDGVGPLVAVVRGLVIHPVGAERLGLPFEPEPGAAHLRFVADMLAYLAARDPRPLSTPREPAGRIRANCRNSAVLLIAMLRHQGVPARKRTGFARYLVDGQAFIHEVTEVWDGGRWVLVDADGPAGVDPSTGDAFVTGGDAWRRCRSGAADPAEFRGAGRGLGMPGVRQALLQDVDGLNRVELLSHDWWGGALDERPDAELTPGDLAWLDRAAALTSRPAVLRGFYAGSPRGRSVLERLARATMRA
jgi:hypothetical protein